MSCVLLNCAAGNPAKKYPHFSVQKDEFESCSLFTDIMAAHGSKNDTMIVDVFSSHEIGESLSDTLLKTFYEKGYYIENVIPPTVGRFLDGQAVAKTIETEQQQSWNHKELPVNHAPFYFNSTGTDPELLNMLEDCLAAIGTQGHKSISQAPIKPLVLIHGKGNKVPLSKSIGQGLLTGLLTMGYASFYQVSHYQITLYIVDSGTGKVLWSDSEYSEYSSPNAEQFIQNTIKMVNRIPDKI